MCTHGANLLVNKKVTSFLVMTWAFYLVAVTSFQNSTPSTDYSIYFRLDRKESASAPWYFRFLATTLPPIFCARPEYNQHSIEEYWSLSKGLKRFPYRKLGTLTKYKIQNPSLKYIYLNNWGVVGSYSNLLHDKTNKETYNMYDFEWLAKVAGI